MVKTRKVSGRKRKTTRRHRGGNAGLRIRTPVSSTKGEFLTALVSFLNRCIDGIPGQVGCRAAKGNIMYHLDMRELKYPEEQVLQDIESVKQAILLKQNSVMNKARKLVGKETNKQKIVRFLDDLKAYYEDEYEINENTPDYLLVDQYQIIPGNNPLPSGKTYPQINCDALRFVRDVFIPLQNSLKRGSNSPLVSPISPGSPATRKTGKSVGNLMVNIKKNQIVKRNQFEKNLKKVEEARKTLENQGLVFL
jgi:hypothetical protein